MSTIIPWIIFSSKESIPINTIQMHNEDIFTFHFSWFRLLILERFCTYYLPSHPSLSVDFIPQEQYSPKAHTQTHTNKHVYLRKWISVFVFLNNKIVCA